MDLCESALSVCVAHLSKQFKTPAAQSFLKSVFFYYCIPFNELPDLAKNDPAAQFAEQLKRDFVAQRFSSVQQATHWFVAKLQAEIKLK